MMTASRRVIAYDLRGHGRSPWSGPHSIAQHAADLDEVLDVVGAGPDGLFRFRYSGDAAAAALEEMAEPAAGLKEIGCPVLLVRASRSDLLLEQDMQQAAAELRRCRLASVPGGCVPLFDALAE